ncbi:hypothetical protein Y032_0053g2413 [Ancylostoma ceylanicum]|uniref:Uncharacterized protein n=1 Tax=Ancylostoma ceylanicum TaxID=53326 RepID=A0A016U7U9_9BILA|nr:hypothetical protein Y032_0053g2413 [Ancylostoma ceylanicum]
MGATTHFFILLLCLHAAFFTVTTGRRAPSVDIQNQKGGDLRGGRRGAGRGYNSYRLQFPLEHIWDLYQDEDGKFVIPYEFENRSSYEYFSNLSKFWKSSALGCFENLLNPLIGIEATGAGIHETLTMQTNDN